MHAARTIALALTLAASAAACGGEQERPGARGGGPPGGMPWGGAASAAVPVEAVPVARRAIASYIETNGTLEAENEVSILARIAGPIVELATEEGQAVRKGQRLARIDEVEQRAQLEIARVALEEARDAFQRAKELIAESLISTEDYERAQSAFDSARAQSNAAEILLGFTEIRAPFDGLIVERYIDFAEQVSVNTPLFRISDFDPLLCPIRVPERNLSQLHLGQRARLGVEAFPGETFEARVLRLSPVIDAATGTIKVTLEVRGRRLLRPGMFARVFLETETRPSALVVPKAALALESVGDVVYVAADGVASRREVALGFQEGDFVEIVSGVVEGEAVVTVGQDGLTDGTPVEVVAGASAPAPAQTPRPAVASGEPPRQRGPGGRGLDLSEATPEQIERIKDRMRQRGMSEEQIEARIEAMKARQSDGS